jgi:hypothetical protein
VIDSETPEETKAGIDGIGQIACDFRHERLIGIRCRTSEVDSPCFEIDHEEHVVGHETLDYPYLSGEEVDPCDLAPVRL